MLTTKQIAKKLNITPVRVRQLVKMGRITKCKLMGNSYVYSNNSEIVPAKHGRPKRTEA